LVGSVLVVVPVVFGQDLSGMSVVEDQNVAHLDAKPRSAGVGDKLAETAAEYFMVDGCGPRSAEQPAGFEVRFKRGVSLDQS
jgi:hypothetical protein